MKSRRWQLAVSMVLGLITLAAQGRPAAGPQSKRPMTLVDLVGLSRILDPQLSPDGTHVAYQLNETEWKANRRIPHLWLQQTSGGAPRQLTFGDYGPALSPRWSPDGQTILHLREGQIYLLPTGGGEGRALTAHATSLSAPAWARDGSAIYFLATDARSADERERDRVRDDVYAFEEQVKPRHLWRIAIATGVEQKITDGGTSVLSYRLSHDGTRIALHRAPSTLADDSERGEVWVMDASGERASALTHNHVEEAEAELSPDNTQVLFLSDANERFEPYFSTGIFIVPAVGGTPRLLIPDFPYEIFHASWAPDGRSIFAAVNMGVHSEIFQIDLASRTPKQLTDGRHSLPQGVGTCCLVPTARGMVVQFDEPTRYGDAWIVPESGGAARRVTGVYDSVERDFQLPRQEKIDWKAADGTTIEGLLFYPLDYEAGKRYPLVVQMHGGPIASDKFAFWGWMDYPQVLTAKGYAVLRPNYRGGSGYGHAFLRDMVGHYFQNAHLDVLAGIDHLIKQGIADPDRLAIMGHSAGGHLVNKLITVTNRFKAASSAAGVANWISMYAQTDVRSGRSLWFNGTPWQLNAPTEHYWNQSPLKDVSNVRTPTVFLFGENDARVPKEQGIEMWRALKANGVPTRLYIAPRDFHQWSELRHQLAKGNLELAWFEKYVTGRPYVPETAP